MPPAVGGRHLALQYLLQQVDRHGVGELRDRHLGDLLGSDDHIQGRADCAPGLDKQGQPPLGLVAISDVERVLAQSEYMPVGVLQPVVGA